MSTNEDKMTAPQDIIYDVYWEGPFEWEQRKKAQHEQHVLYAIYGTHPVYGTGSLLYIGKTERSGGKRLNEHNSWAEYESGRIYFYLGSVGEFENWVSWDADIAYKPVDPSLATSIETLLIHAHQPAYNSKSLGKPSEFHSIRIFNSGKYETLLPECSYRYYRDK